MYELDPAAEMRVPDSLFRVSNKASYGLHHHVVSQNAQYDLARGDLQEELKSIDSKLAGFAEEITECLGLGDEYVEDFIDGAAVSYRLLAYEAEVAGNELPSVTEFSFNVFSDQLEIRWDDYGAYCNGRMKKLIIDNPKFVTALHDYVITDEVKRMPEEWHSFMVGSIAMHDLLWHQAAVDRLRYYSETSVN